MKLLMKFTLISILFFTLANVATAQDEHKCPMHKHCWNFSDSSGMKDFSCAMEDFDLSEFPFGKHKSKHKYNGHWAGVELGISGYLTRDHDMSYGKTSPWLNMNNARSMTVNLNPFELNVNLYKDHIGFTTGLGFQISNYYFTNNYVMLKDSSSLVA